MTKAGNLANLQNLHSHSHTLSISHSLTLDMLNNFCLHVYAQKSLSHSLPLTHCLTFSLFHSLTLDMLNKFCLQYNFGEIASSRRFFAFLTHLQ